MGFLIFSSHPEVLGTRTCLVSPYCITHPISPLYVLYLTTDLSLPLSPPIPPFHSLSWGTFRISNCSKSQPDLNISIYLPFSPTIYSRNRNKKRENASPIHPFSSPSRGSFHMWHSRSRGGRIWQGGCGKVFWTVGGPKIVYSPNVEGVRNFVDVTYWSPLTTSYS